MRLSPESTPPCPPLDIERGGKPRGGRGERVCDWSEIKPRMGSTSQPCVSLEGPARSWGSGAGPLGGPLPKSSLGAAGGKWVRGQGTFILGHLEEAAGLRNFRKWGGQGGHLDSSCVRLRSKGSWGPQSPKPGGQMGLPKKEERKFRRWPLPLQAPPPPSPPFRWAWLGSCQGSNDFLLLWHPPHEEQVQEVGLGFPRHRTMQSAEDSGASRPREGERLPELTELTLRLMRTRGLWHIPDLDARSALDILALQPPGSFLVTGFGLSLALTMSTAPHPEALGTFRILESSAGVTLQGSRLSFPDLPELLAFLSTSRDILPQPLLLPPASLGPGAPATEPLRIGTVRITSTGGALSVVNPLYLRCHEPWEVEEQNPETAQRDSLAPPPVGSHRVSWIESPPCPESEPEVRSLLSLEEGEDGLVEDRLRKAEEAEEEGEDDVEPTDGVYYRVQALAQARGSLVAKQLRALQARLREAQGGPRGPEAGDPATELLQDVHRLLADLKDHLVDDPEVQAAHRAWTAPRTRPHEELEAMVEAAVCWVLLRPLQPALWTKLRILRARDLQQLQWRQEVMRAWVLREAPHPEAPGPSPTRRRIHARLARLHATQTPQRKVSILLAICRDVYSSLARTGGQEPLGADDFLPALTEELLWSPDIEATQLDVEFLMEILDPAELLGETGYYLTSWFGALHHIAHFQPAAARLPPRSLSYEARASIRLWQRRRTLHASGRTLPSPSKQLEKPWASLEEDKAGVETSRQPEAAASFAIGDL
ncbi:ras and Rab interactor-like protein isoform X2 [Sminthopsis crassicaudata]|uniref:ras and Rab interactor-like protein isoform X2 n=1 Tax=Sminthopsis crassicaudata TaxID=9301 RepID=UPI003D69A9BD